MKQHDIDTFNQLFQTQAKLEGNVNLYNTTASLGNPNHLHNVMVLIGGVDPRPKLQQMNSYIDTCLKSFEARVAKQRSENAQKQVEISSLKQKADNMRANNLHKKKNIDTYKAESSTLDMKIKASTTLLKDKELQVQKAKEDNLDYIESMSVKERSFVIQKALMNESDEVIQIMSNFNLDPNFRNGDGVSLMQTAIEVGHEEIVEKLEPLASEEAYHPPQKVVMEVNVETPITIETEPAMPDTQVEDVPPAGATEIDFS